jgi:hypothetical protein
MASQVSFSRIEQIPMSHAKYFEAFCCDFEVKEPPCYRGKSRSMPMAQTITFSRMILDAASAR